MAVKQINQVIEAEGKTPEEAKAQIKSKLPKGFSILSFDVTRRGTFGNVKSLGIAQTIDEAYCKAQEKLSADAEILKKEILVSPSHETIIIKAPNEESAVAEACKQISGNRVVLGAKMVQPGKRVLSKLGKRSDNEYEVDTLNQATVEVTYMVKTKVSAVVGVPPKLTEQEIQILYDLLSIFLAHKNDSGSRAELDRDYIKWWYKNQTLALELAEKLETLGESGSHILDEDQARQLHWLVSPVAELLKSDELLTKEEIESRMNIGYKVTLWVVDDMRLLCIGVIMGKVRFSEIYHALSAAL